MIKIFLSRNTMYNGLLEETHIFLWVHKYNLIYGYFIS